MKKIVYFFLLLLFVPVQCTKKQQPLPDIVFNEGITVLHATIGESQEVIIKITAPAKLEEVKFYSQVVGDTIKQPLSEPIQKFLTPKKYNCAITLSAVERDMHLIVEARDQNNQTSISTLLVTLSDSLQSETTQGVEIDDIPTPDFVSVDDSNDSNISNEPTTYSPPPARYYTEKPNVPEDKKGDVTMGFNKIQSLGSSYSLESEDKEVMKLNQARENASLVDFMFFYGKENAVTIVAPSDELAEKVFNHQTNGIQNWDSRNETTFTIVPDVDFDTVTLADLQESADGATETNINHLEEGTTILVKTQTGVTALLHISFIGADSASAISFDIKILE